MVSQDKRKKNHDNPKDWGYGGVVRRDFRASKDGPEVIKQRRKRTKKEKKACKRSPDRVHSYVYNERYSFEPFWTTLSCEFCGKIEF